MADVLVVGGGASGLAAAIFAAEARPGVRVVILDTAKSLGAKILVSGGGRCNVTHERVVAPDFNGRQPVVRNVLAGFDHQKTVQWFESLGVPLKREPTGKLFPTTDSARTVLDALLRRASQLGIKILSSHRVTRVDPPDAQRPWFGVAGENFELSTKLLILAAGGQSLPRSGSDGSGWTIARALGHTVTPTAAALVPLALESTFFHAGLSGIAIEAELTTVLENKPIDRRAGSLLWTHFGVSGPVVMDASRHFVLNQQAGRSVQMLCNLLPGDDFQSVEKWLIDAALRARPSIASIVAQRLPERVAIAIVTHVGIDPSLSIGQLTRQSRRALVHAITALPLPVLHHRGWNYAEVTAGGIPLSEIDHQTMQSRRVPRLYIVGEMLDCDGRIGGFNFQWAWATGFIAGRAAAIASASGDNAE